MNNPRKWKLTHPGASRSICGPWIGLLLLLALPAAMQAQYTYTTNNGTITITEYTGIGGDVTIPATINGLPVTRIGPRAFYGCSNLTSVTIPDSVTCIGEEAFVECLQADRSHDREQRLQHRRGCFQ